MTEQQIGRITHWFGHIGVAVIDIDEGTLSVGDTIHVHGCTSDFTHTIDSMQCDDEPVETASKGMSVGVKVPERARRTDVVFRTTG